MQGWVWCFKIERRRWRKHFCAWSYKWNYVDKAQTVSWANQCSTVSQLFCLSLEFCKVECGTLSTCRWTAYTGPLLIGLAPGPLSHWLAPQPVNSVPWQLCGNDIAQHSCALLQFGCQSMWTWPQMAWWSWRERMVHNFGQRGQRWYLLLFE